MMKRITVSTLGFAASIVLALAGTLAWAGPEEKAPTKPASSRIQLDQTVISGNQELPKVLYIVPWQDPSGMPMLDLSPEFTEQEVFRRLYPPAYRREIEYYELLDATAKE
jgi:hypothetical protein